ncbi:superoxide dismutase [Ni] [Rubritalea tangerina]|uniref:Superoxide dismutase [Ni] n=1 Tax=Rubritalea tangerina TaxID=430798 RepID=A0ABW4ZAA9_9BACT
MKTPLLTALGTAFVLASAPLASAHCQIPCGIYADDNVFVTLHKDQETIAKAMQQIKELSKDPAANVNQISRWVTNKEQHAQNVQNVVAQYFLAQRIKINESDKEAYTKKLTMLHQITVYAMKCKQTTDLENAKKLHELIDSFHAAYSGKQKDKSSSTHSHGHGHSHDHKHSNGHSHKH